MDTLYMDACWTQHSRGCVRGGISNVRFEGCVVERAPPIAGITPCLATQGRYSCVFVCVMSASVSGAVYGIVPISMGVYVVLHFLCDCVCTAGGPQIGCTTTEQPSYNITVIDHTSDATGDDAIALFNVQSGLIANAYIRDSFARGINLEGCSKQVRLRNNTLVRCPLAREHY